MAGQSLEIVQRVYDAINGGDFDGSRGAELTEQLFDPDVELRQLADIAGTSGTFRGYGGLVKAKLELEEGLAGVEWMVDAHTEIENGLVTTATCRGTGRQSGVPFEITVGHLWELRAGRVVRWVVYRTPEEALESL
jgi:ketosteroid isomerase-like protein